MPAPSKGIGWVPANVKPFNSRDLKTDIVSGDKLTITNGLEMAVEYGGYILTSTPLSSSYLTIFDLTTEHSI